MDCRALAFHQLPHQPKLFLAYLEKFETVKAFYAHPPTMQAVARESTKLDYPEERRAEVVAILSKQNAALGAGTETISNLARLGKGAVAVVSGQQVGLFGGPAYAIYKALTAIKVAEELTHDGIDAVPVFWMATEDHDLEEVRHTVWFDAGKLIRYELPDGNEEGKPVGRIPLGPNAERIAKEAAGWLERDGSDLLGRYLV